MLGRDKLREEINGVPLLRRQAQIARAVSDQVMVALPPRPHPRYASISDLDVSMIEVRDAAEGMGASIRTAFAALPANTGHAMLLLADLPDITQDDLCSVFAALQTHPEAVIWRGATEDGKPGHPIIFDASLFAGLTQLSGDGGGQNVVKAAGSRVHLVPLPGQRARLDLDTPEEWADWRTRQT